MKRLKRLTMEIFGKRLRQLRERRGLSRQCLGDLCGLSKNTIARYERGSRAPRMDDAEALADFFGVTLDFLAGR